MGKDRRQEEDLNVKLHEKALNKQSNKQQKLSEESTKVNSDGQEETNLQRPREQTGKKQQVLPEEDS